MLLIEAIKKPCLTPRMTIFIYISMIAVFMYLAIRYLEVEISFKTGFPKADVAEDQTGGELASIWGNMENDQGNTEFQRPNYDSEDHVQRQDQSKETLVRKLVRELATKLKNAEETPDLRNRTCQTFNIAYTDPCNVTTNSSCPPRYLPDGLNNRIKQIVMRENLQISSEYRDVLKDMQMALPGHYDVIFVTAVSSNHYDESQALLKNLHEVVFPLLKNVTLVVYDIGLTEEERKEYQKYCRCHVLPFPFDRFPPYMRTLKCYAWKPVIVRAHYDSTNIIIWTDASIRIYNGSAVPIMIDRARKRGIQQRHGSSSVPNPYRSLVQTFHHFGDNPCAHMTIPQVATGFGIYHRELFVEKAIMDPWCACALQRGCTCPFDPKEVHKCPSLQGLRKIGLCSRPDQASISILLGKLFREKYHHFVVPVNWFQIVNRTSKFQYFEERKRKSDS